MEEGTAIAGILNSKTRIMDSIITQEGRRQMASGKMKAEFFSFTDGCAIYVNDTIVSGSSLDETYRLCFEASSLPQDQVTFEADDSGKLMALRGSGLNIAAGQLFSGSNGEIFLTGSQFASSADNLLSSASLDSFEKLRILSSPSFFDQDHNTFLLSQNNITFTISDRFPISSSAMQRGSIDQIESLFMDKRLSHVPNFRYLPPVNKARIGGSTSSLGTFPSLGQAPLQTVEDLNLEVADARKNGFEQVVRFFQKSAQNNIFAQFFEVSGNSVTKLDVIDFGLFTVASDNEYPTRHVFFVGKIFIDGFGSSTFVNLFTLIFR